MSSAYQIKLYYNCNSFIKKLIIKKLLNETKDFNLTCATITICSYTLGNISNISTVLLLINILSHHMQHMCSFLVQ